jgi:hypothetical protein
VFGSSGDLSRQILDEGGESGKGYQDKSSSSSHAIAGKCTLKHCHVARRQLYRELISPRHSRCNLFPRISSHSSPLSQSPASSSLSRSALPLLRHPTSSLTPLFWQLYYSRQSVRIRHVTAPPHILGITPTSYKYHINITQVSLSKASQESEVNEGALT